MAYTAVLETVSRNGTEGSNPSLGIIALWRNGRREELKPLCRKRRVGSTPTLATSLDGPKEKRLSFRKKHAGVSPAIPRFPHLVCLTHISKA